MVVLCITSFFIHTLKVWGLFSPIHLLSIIVLYTIYMAITAARMGNIKKHQLSMKFLYFLALIVTGVFTFMPGRIMNQALFF